jgi:hypothetical protein
LAGHDDFSLESAASTKSKSCLEAFFCEGSNIFVSCPLFTT